MQTAAEARRLPVSRRPNGWIGRLASVLSAEVEWIRETYKNQYYKPVPEVRVRFTEEDIGA